MLNNDVSFDQFQRYKNAQLIIDNIRENDESLKILEVGANAHQNLEKFLPNDDIIYLDIELPEELKNSEKYIQGDASDMKFDDNEFDVVVALDVFEHIIPERRDAFISELYRVSKKAFIICAPFSSEEVVVAENNCNNIFKMFFGINYIWLEEHKNLELPSFEKLINYLDVKNIGFEQFSHGDINLWQRLLNVHFATVLSGELLPKREAIDYYYNTQLFKNDYNENSYRKFVIGKKIDKSLTGFVERSKAVVYDEKLENLETNFYDSVYSIFKDSLNIYNNNSSIYPCTGKGFNEEEKLIFEMKKQGESNLYIGEVAVDLNAKKIRFDPVEGQYCVLKNLKIFSNGELVKYENVNGYTVDEYEIFLNFDPQIIFENLGTQLRISFEKFSFDLNDEIVHAALLKLIEYKGQNFKIIEENEVRMTQIAEENEIKINQVIESKNAEISDKDSQLNQKTDELNHYKEHYHAAINQRTVLQNQNSALQNQYVALINSTSWKITKPCRVLVRGTKKFFRVCPLTRLPYKALHYWRLHGFKAMLAKIKLRNKRKKEVGNYEVKHTLSEKERNLQENAKFSKNIKFSIVVPLYNTPENFLREMIQSVIDQTYGDWELCLADGSDDKHAFVEKICKEYSKRDKRVVYKKLEKNLGISENTNAAIDMATGDYIGLFDHDDLLHPAVLYYYMIEICDNNADFIYCDELTFQGNINNATVIHFKPDFAIDNLRANNYICHFTAFDKKLIKKAGGFRKEFDGSQDHDMILRLTEQAKNIRHVPKVLYFWRSHPNSVAMDIGSKTYAIEAGKSAVMSHLERVKQPGIAESSRVSPSIYRIKYELKDTPLISIIIPNKDQKDILKQCIDSIQDLSSYKNFEIIIVENNSTTDEIFDYYKTFDNCDNVNVVYWKNDFNYSEINNFGFEFCNGEQIILLNNDIEVITPSWIEEMLMYNQRDDVGITGAMLYYPNDTIQHAGIVLGVLTLAGHSYRHFERNHVGYMGRLGYAHNVTAVTAACLMIKRSVFEEVNGLDPIFKVAFNDIDLCMRVRQKDYLVCWTPYAELYHHESISRGSEDTPEKQARFVGEIKLFHERWEKELKNGDPYYNKNLTLDREDFSFR